MVPLLTSAVGLMLCGAAAPLPVEEALRTAFPDAAARDAAREACVRPGGEAVAQACVLKRLLGRDARSLALAQDLLQRHGHMVGVVLPFEMDGGFRGALHIEPALPVAGRRVHLRRVSKAMDGLDAFMQQVTLNARLPVRFVWKPLPLRFFVSVGRGTPSAYVDDEGLAYNVNGTLNRRVDVIEETLFHELFHYNDARAGNWSDRVLGGFQQQVRQRCGQRASCLAPYAPHTTKVKGGTYYAFQPGNGPGEYAAELAIRYRTEQLASLRGQTRKRPRFKCGPAPNPAAWQALVDMFFGGFDLTPACP